MKTKMKSSRSLVLEILDYFGFHLKLVRILDFDYSKRKKKKKKLQLVWKSSGCTVFFVRRYAAPPFRRYESLFNAEKKPKKTFSSCFAEFLGDVEMFELEDGWLKNPLFGCKSLEEMIVKLDLLGGARRQQEGRKKA